MTHKLVSTSLQRVKLLLPAVAALPLVLAYGGGTGVSVPKPLIALGLPGYVELGVLYRGYIVALAVFATNSINILAGAPPPPHIFTFPSLPSSTPTCLMQ